MTLETLQKDMIAAMKARDKEKKAVVSSLVSAVKKAGIDAGCRDNIPEDMVNAAIMKELKTAQEQLDTCPADREDLLKEYQYRRDVIESYAPQMMSKDEIREFLEKNCADAIASGNKGMVMKTVMPQLKGKADGKLINQVVSELMK